MRLLSLYVPIIAFAFSTITDSVTNMMTNIVHLFIIQSFIAMSGTIGVC